MKHLLTLLIFLSSLTAFPQAGLIIGQAGAATQKSNAAGYSAAAQAAINNLATVPPTATQDNIAIFVDGCVTDGNWSEIDYILLMSMDTEGNSLSDLINGVDATKIGATPPTFTAFVDWLSGTGSDNGAIDLNFTPSTDCVNCSQDDASYSVYITESGNASGNNRDVMGVKDASHQVRILQYGTADDWASSLHNNQGNAVDIFATSGILDNSYVTVSRDVSGHYDQIRDGSVDASPGRTSSGLPSLDVYLDATNLNGVIESRNSGIKFSVVTIGSSAIDQAEMNTRIETFIAAQAP